MKAYKPARTEQLRLVFLNGCAASNISIATDADDLEEALIRLLVGCSILSLSRSNAGKGGTSIKKDVGPFVE